MSFQSIYLFIAPGAGDATPMLHYNGLDWQAAALCPVLAASCRGGPATKGCLKKGDLVLSILL